MAKLTPKYTVWYDGEFHKAGEAFFVSPADVDEMKEHGVITEDVVTDVQEPVTKRGRKKASA